MESAKYLASLLALVGLGFASGAVWQRVNDRQEMETASALIERATFDLASLYSAKPSCNTEQALKWWTDGGNLDKVRGQLCGRSQKSSK